MKKSFFATLVLALMITVSLAFTRNEDPGYKNLKILPLDITKEQMDSVMHHFTNSLNVKCGFCHIRDEATKTWDYASDDKKHKLVARDMMRMTDSINDRYFDLTGAKRDLNTQLMVTCYTCHHGKTEPETKAPKPNNANNAIAPWDSSKRNQ